ncbi:MAG TPA: hypothetical protein VGN01_06760 [Acidobacteriaceae bacterium]|jgi:hypothetical protein
MRSRRLTHESPLRRLVLAALLLWSGPAVLSAQTAAPPGPGPLPPLTQVEIDNAESTSRPDGVQTPEANPSRPTISNPAHIPPVGYLQFEQGFLQANGSPAVSGQFSLVQAVRLSLHPRLMVQFQSQPLAVTRSTASSDGPATSATDTGDLVAGVQGVLVKEARRRPTVALGYLRRVRGGSAPDLDIGGFSQSAVVLASGDLGDFHYDANFNVSEQGDTVRRAQFGQALAVTHDAFPRQLHDKLEISGEIWSFTQPLVDTTRNGAASPRSNAVGVLWALGYTVRPNLVLDAGFDHGCTSTSTAWQGFAGFTYLLPQRLWGRTETGYPAGPHKHVHRR